MSATITGDHKMKSIILTLLIAAVLGIVGHMEYQDSLKLQAADQTQQFDPHALGN